MDAVNLLYYALVCGLLAGFSPRLRSLAARIGCGIAVGIVAAAVLPYVKALLAGA